MTNLYKSLLLLVTITISSIVYGQTGTIRGFVYDDKGEPAIFTSVKIVDQAFGAMTDVNGFYQITKVPVGTYAIKASNIEIGEKEMSVTVEKGKIAQVDLHLEKTLKTVEIKADKGDATSKVKISVIKATKKEISAVPAVGGEADIATYFQTIPGVVSTGDQGGQMYVRGGSPVQNKVLLDGMIIYNPFHSIGFFSVFDTEIIRNADIYTGGFSASYGGRISSIMDITTKDGNKKEMQGRAAVNPFGAKLTLGGPIKKMTEDGDGSSISYILSAKTSYLEKSSKLLYSYIDTAGLPFNFTDLYGKVSINGKNGSKFSVFGFNFRDNVKWQSLSDLNWNSYGVGTNFVMVPSGSPVLISGKFSFSKYMIGMSEKDPISGLPTNERTSDVDGFNLGFDFKYFLGDDEIKYGIEVQGFKTGFNFLNSVNRLIEQNENTTELSGYIDYKLIKGLLVINPSFRAQYYASLDNFSPEPRLGIKYNLNEDFRLKFAGGLYSQNLISANSDRDVVNLFYGFLSGPSNLQDELVQEDGTTRDVTHSLQKATHAIAGFEYDLGKFFTVNVEGYYKWFTQLTNMNRNKIYDDNPDTYQIPDVVKKDFIVETGEAKGVDVVFKYSTDRLYLWSVYSLGKVDRWDGIQTYAPVFDRRHNVNFIATYFLDKDHKWEVNARWNFGSGLPFTQTQGYYHNVDFSQGIGTDLTTTNSDALDILYAPINEGRLPAYHRLDITAKRYIELKNDTEMELTASVTNAYSRQNIFYVDRVTNDKVYQLPVLPSLGFSWTF